MVRVCRAKFAGFFHAGLMTALLLAAGFGGLACQKSAGLPKDDGIAGSGNPSSTHELFRQAIAAKPDKPTPFIRYCEWLPESVEMRALQTQQEAELSEEATRLVELEGALKDMMAEIDEARGYLEQHCPCQDPDAKPAFDRVMLRTLENRTLIEYVGRSIKAKTALAAQESAKQTEAGRREYQLGRLEDAYARVSKALQRNKANVEAAGLQENINRFFEGQNLVAERRLDAAETHFAKMKSENILPFLVAEQLTRVRQQKIQAARFLSSAQTALSRRSFAEAAKLLGRAKSANADNAPAAAAALSAVEALQKAAHAEQSGDYSAAADAYEEA
ncbi:MAG: hypothetical protein C4523_00890, partial [Myxococcales bacterium]